MNIQDIIKKQNEFHATTNPGALPDKPDARDYDAEKIMGSNLDIAVDWIKGYNALEGTWPGMPNKDQAGQFSCVAQAWAHYKQVLQAQDTGEHTELSAKSIYNPIAIPGTGSYVRDGGMRTVNYGVNKESSVPSAGTEAEITAPFDFTPFASEASFYKNLTAAGIKEPDFDTLAKMIILNHGFVSGWGSHCQYFKEFGILNGVRFLKTHGSYGEGSDMYYFEGTVPVNGGVNQEAPLFSIWTAIDIKNIENHPEWLLNDLNYGDSGAEVRKLKNALIKLGWIKLTSSTSDIYDDATKTAVFEYQLSNVWTTVAERATWGYWWVKFWYKGDRVDAKTRESINNNLQFRK